MGVQDRVKASIFRFVSRMMGLVLEDIYWPNVECQSVVLDSKDKKIEIMINYLNLSVPLSPRIRIDIDSFVIKERYLTIISIS